MPYDNESHYQPVELRHRAADSVTSLRGIPPTARLDTTMQGGDARGIGEDTAIARTYDERLDRLTHYNDETNFFGWNYQNLDTCSVDAVAGRPKNPYCYMVCPVGPSCCLQSGPCWQTCYQTVPSDDPFNVDQVTCLCDSQHDRSSVASTWYNGNNRSRLNDSTNIPNCTSKNSCYSCACPMPHVSLDFRTQTFNKYPTIAVKKKWSTEAVVGQTDVEEKRMPRKKRLSLATSQLTVLENFYQTTQYPTAEDRRKLSVKIKLDERKVRTWFKNRRAKSRLQKKADLHNAFTYNSTRERSNSCRISAVHSAMTIAPEYRWAKDSS